MKKILTSQARFLVYLGVLVLFTIIGFVKSSALGAVVGFLIPLLYEFYNRLYEESSQKIDDQLSKYDEKLIDGLSSLHEFESIKSELNDRYGILVSPDGVSNQLLDILNVDRKEIRIKMTPTFLIKTSVEPSAIVQDPGLSILLLDSEDSHDLFVRSFSCIQESYLGTTFSKPLVWDYETMDMALETEKRLAESGKEIKRVFISMSDDKKMCENFILNTKKQRTKYKVNCRYIESNKINEIPILYETWRRLWPTYYQLINNRPEKTNKLILLSPDFGIIDRKIFISYLLDSNLNEIGAAVFYKPNFLELALRYYKQLFEESSTNPKVEDA
jgi:hypothetical protein